MNTCDGLYIENNEINFTKDFYEFILETSKTLFVERQIKSLNLNIERQLNYIKHGEKYLNELRKIYNDNQNELINNYFYLYPYKYLDSKYHFKLSKYLFKTQTENKMKKNIDYSININFKKNEIINAKKYIRIINTFSGFLIEDNIVENLKKYLDKKNKKYVVYNRNKYYSLDVENCVTNIFINYVSISALYHAKKNIVIVNGQYKFFPGKEWRMIDKIYVFTNETKNYYEKIQQKRLDFPKKIKILSYEYMINPEFIYYKNFSGSSSKNNIVIYIETEKDGINILKNNNLYIAIGKNNTYAKKYLEREFKYLKIINTLPKKHIKIYFPCYFDIPYMLDYFKKNKFDVTVNEIVDNKSEFKCIKISDICIIKNKFNKI